VCGILIKDTDDDQTKARFPFVSLSRSAAAKKKKRKKSALCLGFVNLGWLSPLLFFFLCPNYREERFGLVKITTKCTKSKTFLSSGAVVQTSLGFSFGILRENESIFLDHLTI